MKTTTKKGKSFSSALLCVMVILLFPIFNISAQTSTENYIKTTTYKIETANSISNPTATQAKVDITYIDGLGRPKQKISHQQSGNGEDLITHMQYDGFGREEFEFLPYERSASLIFDGNGYSNTTSFYSNSSNGPTTSNPWNQKQFESSALNRVLKQAAPGDDWVMDGGHELRFSYDTNNSTEVHHFSVHFSGEDPVLHYEQKYPEAQLYKAVTKDENWQQGDGNKGTITEFKDKKGQIILRRHYDIPIGENKTSTGSIVLDTYYIYDDFGNLTFVLPPKLSQQIPSNGSISQSLLDALAYQYKYDHRNRVIEKKIPGKNREFMVYDDLDRLVAKGPALSPFGDGAEGWLHTKYDIFNRPVYTLWKQGTVNGVQGKTLIPQTPISEVRIPGTSSVNGVSFSYSNQVAPTSGYHVLTVNYYDDYSYTGAPSPIPTTVAEGESAVYYNNTQKPKGIPTGSWVRQVETALQGNGIKSYTLYDKKARPIRMYSTNPANGYTQIDTKNDFIGNKLKSITKHKKDAAATVIVFTDAFTYTPQSRPLKHTHKINTGGEQLLTLNTYDALGRLKIKKVGGTDPSGTAALQKVDYKYNVRGWMTDINNVSALNEGSNPLDLFAFKILYNYVADDINGAVTPLYNGNVAETYWRTSSDNMVRKYGYAYDYQNRLLDAYYQRPGTSVPRSDSYSTHYSYDRNGNILTLNRNGEQDIANSIISIDDLVYTYDNGNRLKSVRDYEVSPAGYNDFHTNAMEDDFGYDDYGNLILNKDKEITHVDYNHLNLPTKVTFSGNRKIEYFYDASGVKLKKKVTNGSTVNTTEYMDGFQYTNSVLDFFPHTEGYIKAIPSSLGGPGSPISFSFKYVFNFLDHLGNIRLKYAQDPSNNNEISILEEDHYYPYGLKHSGYSSGHLVFTKDSEPGTVILTPVNPFLGDSYKYKFGGKEYDDTFDINTYDFGARNYDPALGRWMNIDPMAEKMRRHSPYNYAFDNPLYWIDPDGMEGAPMVNMGYTQQSATTISGSVDFNGTFDQAPDRSSESGNNGSTSSSSSSSAPSLSKKKETVPGTGLAMGADGVGEVDSAQNVTVDNTKQALDHYYNGNGAPVSLGPETVNSVLYSKEFKNAHNRIKSGQTPLMSGRFKVDLTASVFHVGRTNVQYSIMCAGANCTVNYSLFVDDGFWDANFMDENTIGRMGIEKFQPDGLGPNLELEGGTPYPYIPKNFTSTFENPGY